VSQGVRVKRGKNAMFSGDGFVKMAGFQLLPSYYFAIDSGRRNWLQWVVFVSFHGILSAYDA